MNFVSLGKEIHVTTIIQNINENPGIALKQNPHTKKAHVWIKGYSFSLGVIILST